MRTWWSSTWRPTTRSSSTGQSRCFDDAGLQLPPLVITHHGDDREPCRGGAGLYRDRDGVGSIDICTLQSGLLAERLVLHELAHAWAANDLSSARRQQFQELRGWTHWMAEGVGWDELGSEQAAEIIAWGLSDRPIPSVLIDQSSCPEFELGYRALTGAPPLHGLPDRCRADSGEAVDASRPSEVRPDRHSPQCNQ